MKNFAESQPLHGKNTRKKTMRPTMSIWLVSFAAVLAIVSCIAFSVCFQRGLSGFSKQVNAFVSIGDFGSVFLQFLVFVVSTVVVIYLLFIYLASAHVFGKTLSICGSPFNLFISSFASQGFLIIWVVMLCFVSSISLVYFLFIGGIYSFCALVDRQCFDFRVLIPAIVKRFSNKKMDLTFCAEKKQLLCSQENNQIWNFLIAFVSCLFTFGTILFVQNCVIYGLGKRQAAKQQKTKKRFEMKTIE
ncbi:hypothetical protein DICVIV_11575 [Dictyocaulus viviparus]|uniref:Tetraspanin family protein n=1 Tax=Dictyocaulus viviparus TaxID=29172 RepID=A0A0D8XFG0_DICVI|nr:hypothetical protein DICVIV_11575 [Dictyocaulus viviparus]